MLLTMKPSIMGVRMIPALVADWPRTSWTKGERDVMAPNMPAPTKNIEIVEIAKMSFLNRLGRMIGSVPRLLAHSNETMVTADTAQNATICHEVHASLLIPDAQRSNS